MISTIWLSYDLGVNGDYEGLYSWLDNNNAKECGSNVAYMKYEHDGDLFEELKTDIAQKVDLNRRSRLYVVFREKDKNRGRFLNGQRKSPPWTGFGSNSEDELDED